MSYLAVWSQRLHAVDIELQCRGITASPFWAFYFCSYFHRWQKTFQEHHIDQGHKADSRGCEMNKLLTTRLMGSSISWINQLASGPTWFFLSYLAPRLICFCFPTCVSWADSVWGCHCFPPPRPPHAQPTPLPPTCNHSYPAQSNSEQLSPITSISI